MGPNTIPRPIPAPTRPMPFARSGPSETSAMAAWHAARFPAVIPARIREANKSGKSVSFVASEAQQHDLAAPDSIGNAPEYGRRQELRKREARQQHAHRARRAAHGLHVQRQKRDDDAESEQIQEDRDHHQARHSLHARIRRRTRERRFGTGLHTRWAIVHGPEKRQIRSRGLSARPTPDSRQSRVSTRYTCGPCGPTRS
jgi:hypothetical protein